MTSLFSPFDMKMYSFCFFFIFASVSILLSNCYKLNLSNTISSTVLTNLSSFFFSLKPKSFNKNTSLMFASTILLVLLCNFLSVFSFNFPLTSQVSIIFFLGLSMWVSFIFYSLIFNLKGFLSHLIPEGTPLALTTLLFLIELISNLIRPLTLTVRLVANILAGHLLMSLLSGLVFNFSLGFLFYLGLNMIELFVALIQSYIFSTMIVLYFSEV